MSPARTAAGFDLVDSYARTKGGAVEIVLAGLDTTLPDGPLAARLRRGRGVVTFAVTTDAAGRVVLNGPRADLTDGEWSIVLNTGGRGTAVDARLLVQGARPVVLLLGAQGLPSLVPDATVHPAGRKRLASAGGRVLDRVLLTLPPDRARQVRRSARRAARAVLR